MLKGGSKTRIKLARLVENRDLLTLAQKGEGGKFTQKGELSATGQTSIEYRLTLEAGKHVAMLPRTEKAQGESNFGLSSYTHASLHKKAQSISVDGLHWGVSIVFPRLVRGPDRPSAIRESNFGLSSCFPDS